MEPQSSRYESSIVNHRQLAASSQDDNQARVHIDTGGLGAGAYDRLAEQGYGAFGKGIINAVNFGNKPITPPDLDESSKPQAVRRIAGQSCGLT